jgi:prepilin-type N-terminal cleavage/methylation domain-containing protein
MNKMIRQAFTLIELLVVIAIIGILSGLIVITMSGVTQKATIAKAQVFSNSLRNSLMINTVSDWNFDGSTVVSDGSFANSSYLVDMWGGQNGTITAAPPTVLSGSSCVSGSCLNFSGFQYVSIPYDPVFNFSSAMTAMIWVKTITNGTDKSMFSQANLATNSSWIIATNGGVLRVYLYSDGASNRAYSARSISDGNWHLVGFTWNAGTVSLYIDGQPVSSTSVGATLTSSLFNSTYNLCFGCYSNSGATSALFTGQIDGARLYNDAIPTSQIKEQYYAGLNSLLASGSISEKEYLSRINNLIVGIN